MKSFYWSGLYASLNDVIIKGNKKFTGPITFGSL